MGGMEVGPSPPRLSHSSHDMFLRLLSSFRSARPRSVFWRSRELGGRVSAGEGMAWRKDEQWDIQGWE